VRLKGGCEGDVLEVIRVVRQRGVEHVTAAHDTKGGISLTADDFEKIQLTPESTMDDVDPNEVAAKIKWLRDEHPSSDPLKKAREICVDLGGSDHLARSAALWRAVVQRLESN